MSPRDQEEERRDMGLSVDPDYQRFLARIGCDYRPLEAGFRYALEQETLETQREFNEPGARNMTEHTARERSFERIVEWFLGARADDWAVDWTSMQDMADFLNCRRYACIWAVFHGRASLDVEERWYALTEDDVGQRTIRCFGRVWPVSGFMGRVLKQDVGKRVYQRGEILQVENDEQRDRRLAKAKDEGR